MPKLGSGEIQFQGTVLGPAIALCVCFHRPQCALDRDRLLACLADSGVDLEADFTLLLDADGKEDVVMFFGNAETFKGFQALVDSLPQVAAGQPDQGRLADPLLAEVAGLIGRIYSLHALGCCWHVVLDDENWDCVDFCCDEARMAGSRVSEEECVTEGACQDLAELCNPKRGALTVTGATLQNVKAAWKAEKARKES